MQQHIRLLAVYQDGQTTQSYYCTEAIAKTVANSIAQQRHVTYCEALNLNTGEILFEHHRSFQFYRNNR